MFAVMIGAAPWYSSEVLWSVLGILVSLGIGLPTFLFTWEPRQRLYYWALPPTALLASDTRSIAEVEIRHEGRQLADPYLLEVVLTVRGRRDIPSSAFDQGRPLVFDLGAGIVKVLQVRVQPSSSLSPPVAHEGSTLRVGPELIGYRQTVTISVLIDGFCSRIVCTQPVLAQVTVIQQKPQDRSSVEALFIRLALVTAAAVLCTSVSGLIGAGPTATLLGTIAAALLTAIFTGDDLYNSSQRPKRTRVVTALLLTLTSVMLTIGGFTLANSFTEQSLTLDYPPNAIPAPTAGSAMRLGALWLHDGDWGDIESQDVGDENLVGRDFGYWRQENGKGVFAAAPGGKLAPVSASESSQLMTKCREILDDSSESSYELDGYPFGSWFCATTDANIAALQIISGPSSGGDTIAVIYIIWNQ